MRVRSPGIPDEPADDDGLSRDVSGVNDDANTPPAGAADSPVVRFRVPAAVVVAKLGAAVTLVLLALLAANGPQRVIGLGAAAGIAIYGLRDLLTRERLRVDVDGITMVRGFAGTRHLPWSQIERIHVDSRSRLGARSETLEVDAGEELYLFGRMDLGMDPRDAAVAIARFSRAGESTELGDRDVPVAQQDLRLDHDGEPEQHE